MRNISVEEAAFQPLFSDDELMGRAHAPECASRTAVLVCHGMGAQMPFDTLADVAEAIVCANAETGIDQASESVRLVKCSLDGEEKMLPRAEITLPTRIGTNSVHLYEAYWAPLTEGVISYWETVAFLAKAGWTGLKFSKKGHCKGGEPQPSGNQADASLGRKKGDFYRWKFGEPQACCVTAGTFRHYAMALVLIIPLLAGAGIVASLGAEILHALRSIPDEVPTIFRFWEFLFIVAYFASLRIKEWLTQYLGDVAIYVTSNTLNKFWNTRDEIKRTCKQVADVIYRAKNEGGDKFAYDRVIIVGHSLGSVIAYDTLNALLNEDAAFKKREADNKGLNVQKRTPTMLTFGSPLDKIAFIFQVNARPTDVRQALSGAAQPLIQSYEFRPAIWANIYSSHDVISGPLDYFDDARIRDAVPQPKKVRNIVDKEASWNPATAHTGYWNHSVFRELLYKAVTGTIDKDAKVYDTSTSEGWPRPDPSQEITGQSPR